MEVLEHDGNPVIGLSEVINKWERDVKPLLSSETLDFDDKDIYEGKCNTKRGMMCK